VDTVTGQLLRSVDLRLLSGKPDSAAISADGSRVATASLAKASRCGRRDRSIDKVVRADSGYALAGLTFSPMGRASFPARLGQAIR